MWTDDDRADAAQDLRRAASAVNIDCAVHSTPGGHTWQFASGFVEEPLPWLVNRLNSEQT